MNRLVRESLPYVTLLLIGGGLYTAFHEQSEKAPLIIDYPLDKNIPMNGKIVVISDREKFKVAVASCIGMQEVHGKSGGGYQDIAYDQMGATNETAAALSAIALAYDDTPQPQPEDSYDVPSNCDIVFKQMTAAELVATANKAVVRNFVAVDTIIPVSGPGAVNDPNPLKAVLELRARAVI